MEISLGSRPWGIKIIMDFDIMVLKSRIRHSRMGIVSSSMDSPFNRMI